MRGEDISLPSFLRDIAKAKYIPELAYYGLHLLCSPFHGTEDKVQVKQNFTILTAPWKRSACFFPSPHAIFTCIVSTFDFSFPLCAIFARSELKFFFFFSTPVLIPFGFFAAALACSESHALLTLMTNGLKTRESCSATGSLNLREENSRWLPVAWNVVIPC